MAGGRQYIAVPAGIGGGSWSTLIPPELAPQIRRPNNGNSIYVFALPARGNSSPGGTVSIAARGANAPEGDVTSSRTVLDGVYTVEQARRGQAGFAEACASCHRDDLGPSSTTPSLVGQSFRFLWGGETLGELFDRTRRLMPPSRPGSLSDGTYRDILAFILESNQFPPGESELGAESLEGTRIVEIGETEP
jgi:cytochrome c553